MRRWLPVALAATLLLGFLSFDAFGQPFGVGGTLSPQESSSGLPLAGGTLTGPLLLPDGTALAPAVAFSNDVNTGFYLGEDGRMNLATNGFIRAYWDATSNATYSPIDANGFLVYDSFGDFALGAACDAAGTTGNVCVGGALFTVDNQAQFDGGVVLNGTSTLITDSGQIIFGSGGTAADSLIKVDSGQDALKFYLGTDQGNQLVFASSAAGHSRDSDHAQTTDPTIFIHSATDLDSDNTQWLSLAHDQTNAVIATGSGAIQFAAQTSHAAYAQACATATDDFDIDWSNGNIVVLDMEACDQDANDVNAPTNPAEGASYVIHIEQSTAGTEDLTWNAAFLWPGGTAPVLTQTNNARDVISCLYSDSVYLCSFAQDYQ